MYHSFTYQCDSCGDQRDLCTNADTGGQCHSCINGTYHKCGESYDQEFVDQMEYEEQQDREYEERHRHGRW